MKIGILTWHSQLNYGGVLQAWAHQEALRRLGHEPVILDWWENDANDFLWRGIKSWGAKDWLRTIMRAMLGTGDGSLLLRQWRTMHFMRKHFHLTPYHFHDWNQVVELGVEAISVGSDQIWYCGGMHDPKRFLLVGLPQRVPAISYAASFGMQKIPDDARDVYKEGFKNFVDISVREKTGRTLVELCDATATVVADPTLLIGPEFWNGVSNGRKKKRMVCYIISEDVKKYIKPMLKYAWRNHCSIDVLVDSLANPVRFALPSLGIRSILRWLEWLIIRIFSPVRFHLAAGPLEFVKCIANARWVVSDSFHALMFSTIYAKKVQIIRPTSELKRGMFSRMTDFADEFWIGDIFADSFTDALVRLESDVAAEINKDQIHKFVQRSWGWLSAAIAKMKEDEKHDIKDC